MKRVLALALCLGACAPSGGPVIDSFTSDAADGVPALEPVTLSWSVRGADAISISPGLGAVTGSSATVNPAQTTTYTLRASSHAAITTRSVIVYVDGPPRPATIESFFATPAIVPPNGMTTFKWRVSRAAKIELVGPAGAIDVSTKVQLALPASATGTYQLRVTGQQGTVDPAPVSTLVRVSTPPSITAFTATPAGGIDKGNPVVLSWAGSASSWSISDGTTTRSLGNSTSLTLRPQSTTTYTLTGRSLGGSPATQTRLVTVADRTGTTFSYTPPAASGPEALELVADPCAAPCATITFHLRARNATGARGVALNLPMDLNKVTPGPITPVALSGALVGIAAGNGALQDTLVLGAALKGAAGQPAADKGLSPQPDLLTFTLILKQAGGIGNVFDGATAGADPRFAFQLRGQAANPGGVAIGRLDVQ